MAGFPPLAGFCGKFLILKTLIAYDYYFTSLLFILFSILSTFYYVRILKCFLFEDNNFYKV
jgi:NADH:ubiquinone oxidoreductase subunit 2 (subunit N)